MQRQDTAHSLARSHPRQLTHSFIRSHPTYFGPPLAHARTHARTHACMHAHTHERTHARTTHSLTHSPFLLFHAPPPNLKLCQQNLVVRSGTRLKSISLEACLRMRANSLCMSFIYFGILECQWLCHVINDGFTTHGDLSFIAKMEISMINCWFNYCVKTNTTESHIQPIICIYKSIYI